MPKYYIGCSGFSSKNWRGYFYPKELPLSEQLKYYSEHFSTVEVSSTFYQKPSKTTLKTWYESTPDDFKFFIKMSKQITHTHKLKSTEAQINEFCDFIAGELKDKLAGFVFQLPPSFFNTKLNLLTILENINNDYLNVVEFRNLSWWIDEDVQTKLKKKGIIMAGVDLPSDIPNDVILNNTKSMYYKLYGSPEIFNSHYSPEFLKDFTKRVKEKKKSAYIFFNNTNGTAAIDNATQLKKLLK